MIQRTFWSTMVVLLAATCAAASPDGGQALIEVNGEPILAADLDRMIMQSHASLDMDQQQSELLLKILEKAVNDRLILQEARAMGLDQEPDLLGPLEEMRIERAWKAYARDAFRAPTEIPEQEIEAHYREFYRRVHIRQLTVRTEQEAKDMVRRIRAGESMEALALEHSLDTRKPFGGLHNFKLYKDLELELRPTTDALKKGQLSEPFAYREAWAILRLEDAAPADPAQRAQYEPEVVATLRNQATERAWKEFVEALKSETPVVRGEAVIADIQADSELVFRGEFLRPDPRPALWIEGGRVVDGTELRKAISKTAMQMGDSPFGAIAATAIAAQSQELVLVDRALKGGYHEREPIVQAFERELEQRMIEAYLNLVVVDRIRLSNEDTRAFYEANPDRFAGDPQVKLSFLFVEEEGQARSVAERLFAGADFDFVRKEVEGSSDSGSSESKFAPESGFSDAVREAIAGVAPGRTTEPVPLGDRFMIIRVDGRRPGEVKPLAEVEMQIREIVFQQEFNRVLDEHLALLKERSVIVRHEDRISAYFSAE